MDCAQITSLLKPACSGSPKSNGFTVLFIDNDKFVSEIMKGLSEDYGFNVLVESTGAIGIQTFKKQLPDIVFVDMCLPDVEGLSVVKQISAFSPLTSIIAVSERFSVDLVVDLMKNGACDCLSRPFDLESLYATCEKALELNKRLSASKTYHDELELIIARDTEKMKENESMLKKMSMVVEQAANIVLITNKDGYIEYVNNSFTNVTKYSKSEVLGKKPNILKSGLHDNAFYEKMWEDIDKNGVWRGDIHNMKKDGSFYWESALITAIKDNDSGNVTHYVAVKEDITWKKNYEDRIMVLSNYDSLTGLPNLFKMREYFNGTLATLEYDEALFVLLINIDSFNVINESMGHEYGDILLKKLSERIKNHLPTDINTARIGGDQFAFLSKQYKDVYGFADVINGLFKEPFSLLGQEVFIKVSIGATVYPVDGESIEKLLQNANAALTKAKSLGKNQCQIYTRELTVKAQERLNIEMAMHKALESEEFILYYQPKVSGKNFKIVGIEVLLRWQKKNGEQVISPDTFIPVLEETGLIIPVGKWVIRESLRQYKEWLQNGMPPYKLSINISARQLYGANIKEIITQALADFNMTPEFLCLELTESIIMEVPETVAILKGLADMGVSLSIDDFGTGYSSFNYLRRLPVNEIKIDKSFVSGLPEDKDGAAIVESIIGLGKCLGLNVVAEGVESEEQVEFLSARKCDELQGYYFGVPQPGDLFFQTYSN